MSSNVHVWSDFFVLSAPPGTWTHPGAPSQGPRQRSPWRLREGTWERRRAWVGSTSSGQVEGKLEKLGSKDQIRKVGGLLSMYYLLFADGKTRTKTF